jgi:hypothetical protein
MTPLRLTDDQLRLRHAGCAARARICARRVLAGGRLRNWGAENPAAAIFSAPSRRRRVSGHGSKRESVRRTPKNTNAAWWLTVP